MINLEDFCTLELGTLVNYFGKTYFIIPTANSTLGMYADVRRKWCRKNNISEMICDREIYGYNINDVSDEVLINPYINEVSVARKQFTKEQRDSFFLKLKMSGIWDKEEGTFESNLKPDTYYLVYPHLPDDEFSSLVDTKEFKISNTFRKKAILCVIRRKGESDDFEVSACLREKGKYYIWKTIVINTNGNGYLERTLRYPFIEIVTKLPEKSVKFVKQSLKEPDIGYYAEILKERLLYAKNHKEDKGLYFEYLCFVYLCNTKNITEIFNVGHKILMIGTHYYKFFDLKEKDFEPLKKVIDELVPKCEILDKQYLKKYFDQENLDSYVNDMDEVIANNRFVYFED